MRLVLSILATILFINSFACDCVGLRELSKQDIETTDYIALVRIKEILPTKVDSPKYYDTNSYFKITIQELTRYKGHHFSEIIVAGGNLKLNTWTSCDFGMTEGQEWVIFAQYDKGKPFVYPCWRTVLYRQENGSRDWQHKTGFKELTFLENAYDKTQEIFNNKEGKVTTLFPNGSVEKVEQYKNGQLNGRVEYYFPDGKLYGKSDYLKGQLHGKSFWYYQEGVIETETKYRKGIQVDTSVYYIRTAKGYKPFFVHVFDNDGNLLRFQHYAGDYQERYLWNENIYEPTLKRVKIIFYHKNGQVQSIGYTMNNKSWGDYTEYDEQGSVIRSWKYDEQGKVIK